MTDEEIADVIKREMQKSAIPPGMALLEEWPHSLRRSEVTIHDLRPGSWNPVDVVLSPATETDLGYLEATAEVETVELQRIQE